VRLHQFREDLLVQRQPVVEAEELDHQFQQLVVDHRLPIVGTIRLLLLVGVAALLKEKTHHLQRQRLQLPQKPIRVDEDQVQDNLGLRKQTNFEHVEDLHRDIQEDLRHQTCGLEKMERILHHEDHHLRGDLRMDHLHQAMEIDLMIQEKWLTIAAAILHGTMTTEEGTDLLLHLVA
jgi:hypothetical protein